MRLKLISFLLILSLASRISAEPPEPPAPALAGTLVIVGGGDLPDSIRDQFLKLAGGKAARLVVIPTASLQFEELGISHSYLYWKAQTLASVELLHARNRDQANDPDFSKPLTRATAIWLGGGTQSRLTQRYAGTAFEKALHNFLRRGGVIGGNSAGAAAMSSIMIKGGNPVAEIGTGLGLLSSAVIDQHFQNRKRLARLLGVLEKHPQYAGLGIDEETALIIRGDLATVLGKANVWVCLSPVKPLPESVQALKDGETIDLSALAQTVLARLKPLSVSTAAAVQSKEALSAP